ncbi:unnamed protein product [Chilo suppressalis]|uniref:BED-type domain-containing protein n=1 Tax=Chilo suppressalis TaxID=168631 RepID=A0ABN8B2H4_CHISP|nr:unnamed protein product [Chilo suppressalis]
MSLSKPSLQNECGESDDEKKLLWDYFEKNNDGRSAKCSLCSKTLLISNRSSTGLKGHLQKIHCVNVTSASSSKANSRSSVCNKNTVVPTATTSKNDDDQEVIIVPKKKAKKTIDAYFVKENSMEAMVTRMVCRDGLTLSSFCSSSDLRRLFSKSGFQLPNSPNTIRSIITDFANAVEADLIIEFANLKKQGQRFSLSFDEWTSQKNHRYINLNVHHKETHFNLGLIRIHGSCTAEHCITLVSQRLKKFGLNLETDIIGITTDGASVMVKVGRLLPCYQQLCFAHGIQLAVVDVLYKKKTQPEEIKHTEIDEDDADEYEDEETEANERLEVVIQSTPADVIPRYNELLKKVRKVVKTFRKSPTKDDMFLQKYVKEEKGKELSLILDCQTRWSSLFVMLERFYNLKNCIDKVLIDAGSDTKISADEWSQINELIACLQPVKLAVEVLCRRESSLATADTNLKFVLDKLKGQDTALSAELSEALRKRIGERRLNEITGLLIYLQKPKKYEQEVRKPDDTFTMPKKNVLRQEMKNMLNRVNEVAESAAEVEEEVMEIDNVDENLTLEQQLALELKREKESFIKPKTNVKDYDKNLKKEMSLFETEGVRGENLSLIYDFLMTLKPTSVEAERAFSAAGYICSKLRSRLTDKTINTICFLRAFFHKTQKK